MPRYTAFGFTLDSAIALPELDSDSSCVVPDWRIQIDDGAVATPEQSVPIAADLVYDGVQVRAYTAGAALGLTFDDTGTFEVRPGDRVIVWRPGPQASEPAVRADLLGRVMALVGHADGHLALHASAVQIGGVAVAFLGPKQAGKSTLALALVRRGARLITDDTLLVRRDPAGTAWAALGVQRVRLWPDSARALAASAPESAGAKPTIDRLTPNELAAAPAPLAACYVLEPGFASGAHPVHRERLSGVHAALACVRFAKLGVLAAGPIGRAVLERATGLAGVVPMFGAKFPRDLERLDMLTRAFLAWHEAADPSTLAAVP